MAPRVSRTAPNRICCVPHTAVVSDIAVVGDYHNTTIESDQVRVRKRNLAAVNVGVLPIPHTRQRNGAEPVGSSTVGLLETFNNP